MKRPLPLIHSARRLGVAMLMENLSGGKRVVAAVAEIFRQGFEVLRFRRVFQVLPIPVHTRVRRVFAGQQRRREGQQTVEGQ